MSSNLNITKTTVMKRVGNEAYRELPGGARQQPIIPYDLSLLSRRTERRKLIRLLPYCCVKAKGLSEPGK